LNNSPLRWLKVPLPLEPKLYLPGLARNNAMNSGRLRTPSVAGTTITPLVRATSTIGTKSRATSYGSLLLNDGPMECVLPVAMRSV
jgi:hypothetical protein